MKQQKHSTKAQGRVMVGQFQIQSICLEWQVWSLDSCANQLRMSERRQERTPHVLGHPSKKPPSLQSISEHSKPGQA